MGKTKVGIIFGGKSVEHEVSLQSAKNIIDALDRSAYEAVLIGIDKEGNWHVYDEQEYLVHEDDPKRIALHEPKENIYVHLNKLNDVHQKYKNVDVVFPINNGSLGEDGVIEGMFQILDVFYLDRHVLSSAIYIVKNIAKKLINF